MIVTRARHIVNFRLVLWLLLFTIQINILCAARVVGLIRVILYARVEFGAFVVAASWASRATRPLALNGLS